MSLNSLAFLGSVITLALVAGAVTVWVWPRLAPNQLREVLARAGLLLLVNVLVLSAAAVILNDTYGFFADWADVRGAITGAPPASVVTDHGATASAAVSSPYGQPSPGPKFPDRPLPPSGHGRGRVVLFDVTGPVSGITGRVLVELPAGYLDPRNATRRYPVLETFQGYPGSPRDFISYFDIGSTIGQLVRTGRVSDMLVVSPDTEIPTGVDSECVNGIRGYPQVETWLTVDVPNWVLHNFRVRSDRGSWATMGFSTGGWCAAMATMLHPGRYAAAVVFGGYFSPSFGNYVPIPAGEHSLHRYDLAVLARDHPPPVAIWLETSPSDSESYPSTAPFLKAVRAPLAVVSLTLSHAGHRMSLWQGELPQALGWLGTTMPGFGVPGHPLSAAGPRGPVQG